MTIAQRNAQTAKFEIRDKWTHFYWSSVNSNPQQLKQFRQMRFFSATTGWEAIEKQTKRINKQNIQFQKFLFTVIWQRDDADLGSS